MAGKLSEASKISILERKSINEIGAGLWKATGLEHSKLAGKLANLHRNATTVENRRIALNHIISYLDQLENRVVNGRLDSLSGKPSKADIEKAKTNTHSNLQIGALKEMALRRKNELGTALRHTIPAQMIFGKLLGAAIRGEHAPLAVRGTEKMYNILASFPFTNLDHPKKEARILNGLVKEAAKNQDTAPHIEKMMKGMNEGTMVKIQQYDKNFYTILHALQDGHNKEKFDILAARLGMRNIPQSTRKEIFARVNRRVKKLG